jgi:aspartyl-tRNA(Asn)/glutamyl-tRNA(Gln) amidotransferase subunit C
MSASGKSLDVAHIARLARLALTDEEKGRLAGQLEKILSYVDQLSEVDVEGVAPMTHAAELTLAPGGEGASGLRLDEVVEPLGAERGLAAAPRRDGDLVVVPRIIGEAP